MGITSFETLADADPRRIEIVANRKFPFGDHIKESLLSLPPKVEMKIETTVGQRQGMPKLAVTLTRLTESQSNKRHYADMVVGLEEENVIIYHEKIRMDDFHSPYQTTVVLPNYQQGKLTIKADLIFEEFIGIDVHHKVEHIEETKSIVTARLGTKRSSSLPPAEVSPLKGTRGSTKRAKEQSFQSKVNKEIDMPSFELIIYEPEEAIFDDKVAEDDCKIISGSTIFDHIRKKAKDFPAVNKTSTIHFPSSEAANLRSEFSEEVEGGSDKQEMAITERHQCGNLDINGDATAIEQTNNVLDSTSTFRPQIEVNRKEVRRLEHIIDYVRKRSKNFPVINKPNTNEGFSAGVQGNFSDKEQTQSHMDAVKLNENYLNEPPVGSQIETIMNEYNVSSPARTFKDETHLTSTSSRSLDLPFEVFNNQSNRTYTAKPSLNYSLSRKDIQFEPPGDPTEPEGSNTFTAKPSLNYSLSRKDIQFKPPGVPSEPEGGNSLNHDHPMEANRGSCSFETGDRTRNISSFLGFKSIFSFL